MEDVTEERLEGLDKRFSRGRWVSASDCTPARLCSANGKLFGIAGSNGGVNYFERCRDIGAWGFGAGVLWQC